MQRLLLALCLIMPLWLSAAYFDSLPTDVTQPDGSVLHLYASGDEYFNYLHDKQGYTIIQSPTDGYYYYAVSQRGEPAASSLRVNAGNPAAYGLSKGVKITEADYRARVRRMNEHNNPNIRSPHTGTFNNICILIKFSDQEEFAQPRSYFDAQLNLNGDNDYSLRNYFDKVSYNQLDLVTSIYPSCSSTLNLSYTDSHPRSYYAPYNIVTNPNGYTDEERGIREQTMLANAVAAVESQIPEDLAIDGDDDGYVDNICFVIRGPHTAWAELLWAHRWVMYYAEATIHGKQVWDFTFQPEEQFAVRTLCHEMFHSLGSPDLYHYTFNGMMPVGCWDVMETGNGHMGAYMKSAYGEWINNIPVITQTGDYLLNPLTSATNNCYRINTTGSEYFILEYRKQDSDIFEANLPASGLLIYRINPTLDGNADGPPDGVYIYRPGGTNQTDGHIAQAVFNAESGRTAFNDNTNPNDFLTYGSLAHLNISGISEAGDFISFHYTAANTPLPPTVTITSPLDGTTLPAQNRTITASVNPLGQTITSVAFAIDGNVLGTDTTSPYAFDWVAEAQTEGYHAIAVTAYTQSGVSTTAIANIRIVNPNHYTWFGWMTDTTAVSWFGRGSIAIQTAIDLDLGNTDYRPYRLAFTIADDPWGDPAQPGRVTATINRFANHTITNTILLNLGDLMATPGIRTEVPLNTTVNLSGQIAVVLNLYEYQDMLFYTYSTPGHSWIAETDRPWTDALGRGVLGAAAIELQLRSPYVATDDETTTPTASVLSCYPNPMSTNTNLIYKLDHAGTAEVAIYNLKGEKVRSLLSAHQNKGDYSLSWDGKTTQGISAANGLYVVRLQQNGKTLAVKRLILNY